MKTSLALLAALCPLVVASSAHAQLTAVDPSYSATPYFTHTNADSIVSYDWAADGNIYYQTSTSSFNFGGLYQSNGVSSNQVVAGSSAFSGASVIAIGQYVYYNNSDSSGTQNIFKYGSLGSSPAASLASTSPNYGLYQNGGRLFITGSPNFGPNQIYYSNLSTSGGLAGSPVSLGSQSGSSGPLAFDQAGNLFFAPGFGNLSIYRWTAGDVAAAIANPTVNPLSTTGHLWLDYSNIYGSETGGTSMLLDPSGFVLLTLTNFNDLSQLVKFGQAADGTYNGMHDTLFQDTSTIGELRLHNNNLYVSDGNQIFNIVPEPSSGWLLILAAGLVVILRRRSLGGKRRADPACS